MSNKMLFLGAVLLLAACNEKGAHPQAGVANELAVERIAGTEYDPADSQQEQLDKAEARGAAQAKAAVAGDDAAERERRE